MICKNCGSEIQDSFICPICKHITSSVVLDIDAQMWDGRGKIVVPVIDNSLLKIIDDLNQVFTIGVIFSILTMDHIFIWNILLSSGFQNGEIRWNVFDKNTLEATGAKPEYIYVGSPENLRFAEEKQMWIFE